MNNIVECTKLIGLLLVSLLSIYYDSRENKIPNRMIVISFVFSIILQIISLIELPLINVGLLLSCLLGAVLVSSCFYLMDIWAGGDTKLFIVMACLVPYVVYEKAGYGSIVYIVIYTYSLAFIYLILESVFFSFTKHEKVKIIYNDSGRLKKRFLGWLFLFSIVGLAQNIFLLFWGDLYSRYTAIFLFIKVIIVIIVGTYYLKIPKVLKIAAVILYIVSLFAIRNKGVKFRIDFYNILIVTFVFFVKYWAKEYNYERIKVTELKKGMILSAASILGFVKSDIQGLPMNAKENMSARLSENEVKSVIEWSESKSGSEDIVIVRRIPFAIFIALGYVLYSLRVIIWSNI